MVLDELVKELAQKHLECFPNHGHNIPTSVLSFSAGEFLKVISKARSSKDAYENFNKINAVEFLYKDFVDPLGEDEMSRFFAKIV